MYEKEMHKAVCADRGKDCEVPFKPDPADLFTVEIAIRNEDHQEEGSKLADESGLASFFFYFSFSI
jgi:hypothetical protein